VIIAGAAPTVLKGKGALQDIDQKALVRPHVKFLKCVRRVRDLVPAVRQAFAAAREGVPGPVLVECPVDLLYEESVIREWYAQATPSGRSLSARLLRGYLEFHLRRQFAGSEQIPLAPVSDRKIPQASGDQVARVAAALANAEKPLLLIGSQAMLQERQMSELVRAVVSLDLPVYLSGMHIPRRATLISVNRSRRDLTLNRRPEIGVMADAASFLCDLDTTLKSTRKKRHDWIAHLRARDDEREREIDTQANATTEFINPLCLLKAIDQAIADNSIIVADGGDFVATASYTVRPRGPLSWLDPGVFGTLGVGAGFAMGAKLVRPGSETWILYGDGAFGYSLIEFETFARLKIPVIAVVGNDACWSQIAREQVKLLHDDVGTRLQHTDYHVAAEGLGARGFLLSDPEQIDSVLQQAKEAAAGGQPVLINVLLGTSSFRDGSLSM